MAKFDNWGHVYGIVFNEFKYDLFIKNLIESQKKKETISLENKENEVLFISNYQELDNGYVFLIGRTNEEVSKTKFDTKTFTSTDIPFDEHEHISDYTHIYISKKNISNTGNSYYLLLEKNQRIQIGSIKKLIGGIIGYKSLDDKEKSKLYIGALIQSDYLKKLMEHEIIGKEIIINEKRSKILDLPDNDDGETITTLTQVSKYKKPTLFVKALKYLMELKNTEDKDIFLIVDDGKTKNKKIPFQSDLTKYVPFFQLSYYSKSINKDIKPEIVEEFRQIVETSDYETI